jgi:nucleotide-binding universal stress UspA family protein
MEITEVAHRSNIVDTSIRRTASRRVLVPLDGTDFPEVILPDARRLAGRNGQLVLVRKTSVRAIDETERYLQHEAEKLRAEGVNVKTQALALANAAFAIDEAVRIFQADIVAIATHGRSPMGRLIHGGVAWRALACSPVPVLLRHVENEVSARDLDDGGRHIMVPLDGSAYAETALSVAQELSLEWNAPLSLVQVIPDVSYADPSYAFVPLDGTVDDDAIPRARAYLHDRAQTLRGQVTVEVERGPVVDTLVGYAQRYMVTDIVLASHGRTGLSRMILGSVADGLIHKLHGPIVVVPALTAVRLEAEIIADREILEVGKV